MTCVKSLFNSSVRSTTGSLPISVFVSVRPVDSRFYFNFQLQSCGEAFLSYVIFMCKLCINLA